MMACRTVLSPPVRQFPIIRDGLFRTFFASSTDHTRLLQESQVHRLVDAASNNVQTYVLAAAGLDRQTVQTVPQLHLGRLSCRNEKDDSITIFGAKVVQRTLGDPVTVCSRLVDAALDDHPPSTQLVRATSTLHGLSEWILQQNNTPLIRQEYSDAEWDRVCIMARGKRANEDTDNALWERAALAYVSFVPNDGTEVALFQSKGAQLIEIQLGSDVSEFANQSGGAMARMDF